MLADMIDVKNGTITEDMLLGVQAIFSVPERLTDRAQFKAAWAAEGLDERHIPDEIQPVHVFMRACDSVKTGKRGAKSADRVTEVTPELVSHDDKACVYQITRLVRNKEEQIIDHPKAMTLIYNKDSADIQCVPRDPESYAALHDTEEKVRDYFTANAKMVPGSKVRGAVRDTILRLGATHMAERSAIYFVPIAGYETVEKLQRVLEGLYGDDAHIHVLPYLNTAAARKIVEVQHTGDVKATAESMIAEIHNRLNGESTVKVRKDFVANAMNKRVELGRQIKEYEKLLGARVEAIEEVKTLLDDQIEKLMDAAA